MRPTLPALHRRGFLASGLAAMTAAATGAEAAQPFFKRHGLPIGLQLYTLGPDALVDPAKTFAAVATIGYRAVELPGMAVARAIEIRAALDKAGLICPSVHVQGRGGPNEAAFNQAYYVYEIYGMDSVNGNNILNQNSMEQYCKFCLDRLIEIIILPCRHMCLCLECAKLYNERDEKNVKKMKPVCPV